MSKSTSNIQPAIVLDATLRPIFPGNVIVYPQVKGKGAAGGAGLLSKIAVVTQVGTDLTDQGERYPFVEVIAYVDPKVPKKTKRENSHSRLRSIGLINVLADKASHLHATEIAEQLSDKYFSHYMNH